MYYPFGIDNRIYTELNKIYSNGLDSVSQDPAVNIYVSTLKNHNNYIVDMNIRLGKMRFAEPSFSIRTPSIVFNIIEGFYLMSLERTK